MTQLQAEVDGDTLEPKSDLARSTKDWYLEHGIEAKTIHEVLGGANLERQIECKYIIFSVLSFLIYYLRLTKALQHGIDLTNQEATSNAQKIQKFLVLPTDFSLPGGELGPTLKVKRLYVLKKYESLIQNIYNV